MGYWIRFAMGIRLPVPLASFRMNFLMAAIGAGVVAPRAAIAEESRQWTPQAGKQFSATLVAADGMRATLTFANGVKSTVPISSFSPDDQGWIKQWRQSNPWEPLIDPDVMAPWPATATAESFDVTLAPSAAKQAGYHYSSAHFDIESDLKLPLGVVRDLAAVFEATRAAIIACPLGLASGDETTRYRAELFSDLSAYQSGGGPVGTSGSFNGKQMLLLLPNLGIRPSTNGLTAEHQKHLFVLKHEVSHQLVGRWVAAQPMWLNEGLAEIFAATPYTRGRYSFRDLESGLHDYVLKWRAAPDTRSLRLVNPSRLMSLSPRDWQNSITAQNAYDLYNSAALLTWWFIRYDGKGDSGGLAAYYNALRQRIPEDEAASTYLIRGRSPEYFTSELKTLARKMALTVTIE